MLRRLWLILVAAMIFASPCGAEPILKIGYVHSPGYFTRNENGDYAGAIKLLNTADDSKDPVCYALMKILSATGPAARWKL